MAAAATSDLTEVGLAVDKENARLNNAATNMHTPPASDMSSHGRKDDDAASSSELSDLEDEIEDYTRFENDLAGAGAGVHIEDVAQIEPERYEGGIPIFTPVSSATSTSRQLWRNEVFLLCIP